MSTAALRGIALIATATALIGFGYWIAANKYDKQIAQMERDHAKAVESFTTEARAVEQRLQDAVADIDRQHWETLKDAQTEIDALRLAVAAGSKRVYVKADCAAGVPTDATSPGVGDGASPELDGSARQDYLDFKRGYVHQRAQLMACQRVVEVFRHGM